MRIAEFEKVAGVSRDTLRYYEKQGLLTPPSRLPNGYREYGAVQLEELAFIHKGKEIGFSLSLIRKAYTRYKQLGRFCPEFSAQLEDKKAQLKARIANDARAIAKIEKMLR